MEKQPILVRAIIEMLGAPADYIEKTLKQYVESLKVDKPFKIEKEEFSDSQEQGQLFSVFVELEMRFDKLQNLLDFCYDSMPSSIEVLEPETLHMPGSVMSNFLNDVQAKLHDTDMVVKQLRSANELIDQNSMTVFRNFILYLVKSGKSDIAQISSHVGVRDEDLKKYLDKMVEENVLSIADGVYSISARVDEKVQV